MLELLRFDIIRKLTRLRKIKTDNMVFRLHHTYTVMFLIVFCAIISTKQYVGDPVLCMDRREIDRSLMNTYCWIHSTFTVKKPNMSKDKYDLYPGINSKYQDEKYVKYHKYYRWVCFMLFFQSILFYMPRWLWKYYEGGLIHILSLKANNVICEEAQKRENNALIVNYLYSTMGYHDCYAIRYFACETASLINVVGQIFLVDRFLNDEFLNYGIRVIKYNMANDDSLVDPMIDMFPRITKCIFYYYGPTGGIIKIDNLCMLPLNIINEKIFIFLWFWFIILVFLSTLSLIYDMFLIISKKMRIYVLAIHHRLIRETYLKPLIMRLSIGDWFLIYMLGKNIDRFILSDILSEFSKRINSAAKTI